MMGLRPPRGVTAVVLQDLFDILTEVLTVHVAVGVLAPGREVPLLDQCRGPEVEFLPGAVAEELQHDSVCGDKELLRVLPRGVTADEAQARVASQQACIVAALLALKYRRLLAVRADGLHAEVVLSVPEEVVRVLEHVCRRRGLVPEGDGLRLGEILPEGPKERLGPAGRRDRQFPADLSEPDLVGVLGQDQSVGHRCVRLSRVAFHAGSVPRQPNPVCGRIPALEADTGRNRPACLDLHGLFGRGRDGQPALLVDHVKPTSLSGRRDQAPIHPDFLDRGAARREHVTGRARVNGDLPVLLRDFQGSSRLRRRWRFPHFDRTGQLRSHKSVEAHPLDGAVRRPAPEHLLLVRQNLTCAVHDARPRQFPERARWERNTERDRQAPCRICALRHVNVDGHPTLRPQSRRGRLGLQDEAARAGPFSILQNLDRDFSHAESQCSEINSESCTIPLCASGERVNRLRSRNLGHSDSDRGLLDRLLHRSDAAVDLDPALARPGVGPVHMDAERASPDRLIGLEGPGLSWLLRAGLHALELECAGRDIPPHPGPGARPHSGAVPAHIEAQLRGPRRDSQRRGRDGHLDRPPALAAMNRVLELGVVTSAPSLASVLLVKDGVGDADDEEVPEIFMLRRADHDLDRIIEPDGFIAPPRDPGRLAALPLSALEAHIERGVVKAGADRSLRLPAGQRDRFQALPGRLIELAVDGRLLAGSPAPIDSQEAAIAPPVKSRGERLREVQANGPGPALRSGSQHCRHE